MPMQGHSSGHLTSSVLFAESSSNNNEMRNYIAKMLTQTTKPSDIHAFSLRRLGKRDPLNLKLQDLI